MLRGVTIAIALSGCQVVFPLEEPEQPEPIFPVDGKLTRRFIVNDDQAKPAAVETPYSEQELDVVAVLEDGRDVSVNFDHATGTFSFLRATEVQPYRLVLHYLLENRYQEVQSAADHLTLADTGFGRPDARTAAKDTTTVDGQAQPVDWNSPDLSLIVYATGNWNVRTASIIDATNKLYSADWDDFAFVEPAKHDQLSFGIFQNIGPVTKLVRFLTVPDGVQEGMNMLPSYDIPPVATNGCVRLTAQRAAELVRLQTAYGANFSPDTPMATAWAIQGLAAADHGVGPVFPVAGSLTDDETPLDVTFTQPFAGMTTVAAMGASLVRTLDTTGVKLRVGTSQFAKIPACPNPGSPTSILLESNTVPIATGIQLDGFVIDKSDDNTVQLGTELHELSWTVKTDADLYIVQLQDVTDKEAPITNVYFTTEPHAVIDPKLITPDRKYVFSVITEVGVPDTKTGNFEKVTYPLSTATGMSMTIKLQ